jgi:hypothetical protein
LIEPDPTLQSTVNNPCTLQFAERGIDGIDLVLIQNRNTAGVQPAHVDGIFADAQTFNAIDALNGAAFAQDRFDGGRVQLLPNGCNRPDLRANPRAT